MASKALQNAAVAAKDLNVMSINDFDPKKLHIRCEPVGATTGVGGRAMWTCAQTFPKTNAYQNCVAGILKYPSWDPSKGGPGASAFDRCKNLAGAPKPASAAKPPGGLPANSPDVRQQCSQTSGGYLACAQRRGCSG